MNPLSAVRLVRMLIVAAIFGFSFGSHWPLRAAAKEARPLEQERREVDASLARADSVEMRKLAPRVFALAERLLSEKREQEARSYLEKGLTADAWALPQQLTLGEILARNGQPEALRAKAEMALRVGEEDEVLRRATVLLGGAMPGEPEKFSDVKGNGPLLVLVPLEQASLFAMHDLREGLSRRLGIDVRIASLEVKMPPADRSLKSQWIARSRERILKTLKETPALGIQLAQWGFTLKALETSDDTVVAVMRKSTEVEQGAAAVATLDTMLSQYEKDMQWDVAKVLDALDTVARDRAGPRMLVLGVTPNDLFGGNNNYLFGAGSIGRHVGVVSLLRFRASFNEEAPKRERFNERLLKQSLSTIGHMLGVPRCATPECARAFPQSLAEHDQKPSTLCPACRAGVEAALGKKLPRD